MANLFSRLAVAVVSAMMLTACFTGVESTPKITADDVKREKVVVTAEQLYMDSVVAEPFSQWVPGKCFYVTDNKINLIFGATAQHSRSLAGSKLSYKECRSALSVTGDNVAELVFVDTLGAEYVYRMGLSAHELAKREKVDVPFTIEESLVDDAQAKLLGRTFYIITPVWYDDNDELTRGRKYIPVTITDVAAGNHVYPVRIAFMDDSGESHRMFLSVGAGYKAPRSFSSIFAFDDPHKKYPLIKDETWQNIINGCVALDMTRDECRLSLGAPKEIDRRPGYSGVREMWIYENGAYLIFEDGLLRDFRNDAVKR